MRCSLLSALLILSCTLPAAAQEKAKPNTLTAKEIAEGWILLFDGETTFGWKIDGDVKVDAGVLQFLGDKAASAWTSSYYKGFQIDFEYRQESKTGPAFRVWLKNNGVPDPGLGFFPADVEGWHRCTMTADVNPAKDTLNLERKHFAPSGNVIHHSQTNVGKRSMKLGFADFKDGKFLLRNVKLRPLGLKDIFNGKDLTAWSTFPGRKSQFTVEDGAIHLKNGPGDLQTEGKYADFVLQVECKCNGKYLNSGIFFRCKPNEYQNGYEAQIHNHFTAEPAKDYTIEEFDPKTHELLGKKKVKYAATDYGTGAIYRRVPARKDVAKDGEWFTMTVVAHGNHIATWVNGIQQVDWYDNRPASDNPRNGCRLEAGHISIQGHDPTTDLSFRNIRIAELPGR